MTWHVLDVGSIWLKEFAAVLAARVPTVCWQPQFQWWAKRSGGERESIHPNPALTIRHFPLQRGYMRFPISLVAPFAPSLTARLLARSDDPARSVLVCTTPYYAPVAERWPGPVVYYQTDKTVAYAGANPRLVRHMDRRMCQAARLVCPNSERIAEYLVEEAGCAPGKIQILPNATRAANVYAATPDEPGPLPLDVRDLPRPIAGVIGNLAANMDWVFLQQTIERTPELSWLFVGPTSMPVYEADQRRARQKLLLLGGRVRFIGARPYGELQAYARAFDVAVLPYRLAEPTYSGSSTRFYEHLAACRPIVATRGFAELLKKEPLLQLVATPTEAERVLADLRVDGFRDGNEHARWRASAQGTWETRVDTMLEALGSAIAPEETELTAAAIR